MSGPLMGQKKLAPIRELRAFTRNCEPEFGPVSPCNSGSGKSLLPTTAPPLLVVS
jgi:hypothetical protein